MKKPTYIQVLELANEVEAETYRKYRTVGNDVWSAMKKAMEASRGVMKRYLGDIKNGKNTDN